MFSGLMYALLAGLLGALASSSAKLSLGAGYLQEMCGTAVRAWTSHEGGLTPDLERAACEWIHLPLRLLCFLTLFLCNAVMWTFFSKALRHSTSSARATVTTTASNFVSSALLGSVIFGESRALMWWLGISMTLLGLFILHGSSPQDHKSEVIKEE